MGQQQSTRPNTEPDIEQGTETKSYQSTDTKGVTVNYKSTYYLSLDLFLVILTLTIGPLLASFDSTKMAAQLIWPISWIVLFCAYVVPWLLVLWAMCKS